ncbi:CDGSH iron-sulfur domain-containing protein [Elongatibacter sediminis]|uniref:CDGSH iron-sulfur domain-containing protein n=1 Tax=Elongatibacter sediminis TaxID=3119006 RepID=A0AAW9RGN6_9GAMM
MEDPSKAVAKPTLSPDRETSTPGSVAKNSDGSFIAYMDDSARAHEALPGEDLTTSAKALDRWFRKRQKTKSQPRLLEIPNEALVSSAGPLHLTGNITLVDENGNVSYANHLNLCRCGASRGKPVCDGQHLEREFLHSGRIQEASDAVHSERPCKITLSAIKDGPLTFRGRLRLHNNLGQECVKQRGALCRCGQSTNKPFCDGSHEKVGFRSGR